MRQIFSSPRNKNIDTVVDLLNKHGIETMVTNLSNYNRKDWKRFTYDQRKDNRDSWPQVWIVRADDYTNARTLLKGIGIEPIVRHGDVLEAARNPTPDAMRRHTVNRVRRIVLVAVLGAVAMVVLRYMQVI